MSPRQKRTAIQESILREFLYLNQTSMFSLLSSIVGPIQDEVRASESTTRSKEAEAGGSGTIPFVGGLSIGGMLNSSTADQREVSYKMNAQAHFVALLSELHKRNDFISISQNEYKFAGKQSKYLDTIELCKGRVVEADIELRALNEYTLSKVLGEMIDMVKETGGDTAALLGDPNAALGYSLFNKLQSGMIPVSAYIRGSKMGLQYERTVLQPVGAEDGERAKLGFAGYLKKQDCWQDPTEFLYNGIPMKALIRIQADGPESEWDGMPLLNAFRAIPGNAFDEMFDSLQSLKHMRFGDDAQTAILSQAFSRGLTEYAHQISDAPDDDDMQAIENEVKKLASNLGADDTSTAVFHKLEESVEHVCGLKVDKSDLATLRKEIRDRHNLPLIFKNVQPSRVTQPSTKGSSDQFMKTEIIALYW